MYARRGIFQLDWSNARVVMGLASRILALLGHDMASPPVFPGFESQFDQKLFLTSPSLPLVLELPLSDGGYRRSSVDKAEASLSTSVAIRDEVLGSAKTDWLATNTGPQQAAVQRLTKEGSGGLRWGRNELFFWCVCGRQPGVGFQG